MNNDNDEEVPQHVSLLTADLEFTLGSRTYIADFADDVRINSAALSNDYITHPERFAWYATAYELAQEQEARSKSALELVAAKLDYITRQQLKDAHVKYTEKMVENTVISAPQYREAEDAYLRSKRVVGILKAARDAMIHRRDMLVSLGANYRAEGQSAISLKIDALNDIIK